jgi:hypothetical protein
MKNLLCLHLHVHILRSRESRKSEQSQKEQFIVGPFHASPDTDLYDGSPWGGPFHSGSTKTTKPNNRHRIPFLLIAHPTFNYIQRLTIFFSSAKGCWMNLKWRTTPDQSKGQLIRSLIRFLVLAIQILPSDQRGTIPNKMDLIETNTNREAQIYEPCIEPPYIIHLVARIQGFSAIYPLLTGKIVFFSSSSFPFDLCLIWCFFW